MPIINRIYNILKGAIVEHIIDIPEIPEEKKREIAEKGAEFVKGLVHEAAEGLAEGVAKEMKK